MSTSAKVIPITDIHVERFDCGWWYARRCFHTRNGRFYISAFRDTRTDALKALREHIRNYRALLTELNA